MFPIDKALLYEFLKSKKIDKLYHANTVTTSCSLIEAGGLLSRQAMVDRMLPMTEQYSDSKDKKYNVFNDIFLDIEDLHEYFGWENYYGPVNFVIDYNFLNKFDGDICILKNNPIYWKSSMTADEQYYKNIDEYIDDFDEFMATRSPQRKMITIHDTSEKLSFKENLIKIIIDKIPNDKAVNYNEEMKTALINQIKKSGLSSINIEIRRCRRGCTCQEKYGAYSEEELSKKCLYGGKE